MTRSCAAGRQHASYLHRVHETLQQLLLVGEVAVAYR